MVEKEKRAIVGQEEDRKKLIEKKAKRYAFTEYAGKALGIFSIGLIGLLALGKSPAVLDTAIIGSVFTLGWGAFGAKNRDKDYRQKAARKLIAKNSTKPPR